MEWTPTANEYAISFGNHVLEEAYTNQEYLQRLKPYLTTLSSDASAPKPVKDKAGNEDAALSELIADQTKFILAMEQFEESTNQEMPLYERLINRGIRRK